MAIVYEESFGIVPLRHIDDDHTDDEWTVFIILHKHGNHWGFPKGKADAGEHPLESAKRELEEETGLVVEKLLQEEPITEQYSFYRANRKVEKKVHYFPAIVSGALLLQPEEIRDGKWLTFEKAEEQLTFVEAKKLCRKIEELTRK